MDRPVSLVHDDDVLLDGLLGLVLGEHHIIDVFVVFFVVRLLQEHGTHHKRALSSGRFYFVGQFLSGRGIWLPPRLSSVHGIVVHYGYRGQCDGSTMVLRVTFVGWHTVQRPEGRIDSGRTAVKILPNGCA